MMQDDFFPDAANNEPSHDIQFSTTSTQNDDITTPISNSFNSKLSKNTNTNKNNRVTPDESIKLFDKLWQSTPVKRGKDKALKAFKRRIANMTFKHAKEWTDDKIENLETRLLCDIEWIKGYIPRLSTYLNGELWEDDYSPVDRTKPPRTQYSTPFERQNNDADVSWSLNEVTETDFRDIERLNVGLLTV